MVRAPPPPASLSTGVDGPVIARRDGPLRASRRAGVPPSLIPAGVVAAAAISAALKACAACRVAAAELCAAPPLPTRVIRDVRVRRCLLEGALIRAGPPAPRCVRKRPAETRGDPVRSPTPIIRRVRHGGVASRVRVRIKPPDGVP